jgi:hypothetical protein
MSFVQLLITDDGLCRVCFLLGDLHRKVPSSLSLVQLNIFWRRSLRKACSGHAEFSEMVNTEEVLAKASNYDGEVIVFQFSTMEKVKEFCDLIKASDGTPLPFKFDYDVARKHLAAIKAKNARVEK